MENIVGNRDLDYCSVSCEKNGIPVIGTARKSDTVDFEGYFLVEYPYPWNHRIESQDDLLGDLAAELDAYSHSNAKEWRLQAIRDPSSTRDKDINVILYRNGGKQNIGFEKESYIIPRDKIITSLPNILKKKQSKYQTEPLGTKDILVCTHAQRDRCCGRFGYPIFKYLYNQNFDNIKIWRSSHIGGHRMAPTMLEFPLGRFWGYLNTEIASKVLTGKELSKQEIRYHYRGITGLSSDEQVVDREGYIKYGLAWYSYPPQIIHEENDNQIKIIIQRGTKRISCILRSYPQMIDLDKNRCGQTKPAKKFTIIETS